MKASIKSIISLALFFSLVLANTISSFNVFVSNENMEIYLLEFNEEDSDSDDESSQSSDFFTEIYLDILSFNHSLIDSADYRSIQISILLSAYAEILTPPPRG